MQRAKGNTQKAIFSEGAKRKTETFSQRFIS